MSFTELNYKHQSQRIIIFNYAINLSTISKERTFQLAATERIFFLKLPQLRGVMYNPKDKTGQHLIFKIF